MSLRRPQRREPPETITPLINVAFLLLIFFMMAGRLASSAPFDLAPPTSESGGTPRDAPATLYIAADGRLALGDERIELAALDKAAVKTATGEDGRLRLKADKRAEARRVVAVMDRLRGLGVERIDMLTVRGGR